MLKRNAAGQYIYFTLISATTGAAVTGATVSASRSLDGAAQAGCSGVVVEDGNGQYHLSASQADTNGNDIGFLFTATGVIPVSIFAVTTAADPTDSVRFGLTALPNAAAAANGGLPTGDANAAVKVQTGTGTGQLDFTSGVVKSNLAQILGTALTETAGLLAGGFKKFFNVAAPTLTCLDINQTGDSYARLGAPAGASVSADIAALTASVGTVSVKRNVAISAFPFPLFAANGAVITGAAVTAQRSIDGGAFSACANAVSEISGGWYKINLAASDLNGVTIALKFTATDAVDTDTVIITQP